MYLLKYKVMILQALGASAPAYLRCQGAQFWHIIKTHLQAIFKMSSDVHDQSSQKKALQAENQLKAERHRMQRLNAVLVQQNNIMQVITLLMLQKTETCYTRPVQCVAC